MEMESRLPDPSHLLLQVKPSDKLLSE